MPQRGNPDQRLGRALHQRLDVVLGKDLGMPGKHRCRAEDGDGHHRGDDMRAVENAGAPPHFHCSHQPSARLELASIGQCHGHARNQHECLRGIRKPEILVGQMLEYRSRHMVDEDGQQRQRAHDVDPGITARGCGHMSKISHETRRRCAGSFLPAAGNALFNASHTNNVARENGVERSIFDGFRNTRLSHSR